MTATKQVTNAISQQDRNVHGSEARQFGAELQEARTNAEYGVAAVAGGQAEPPVFTVRDNQKYRATIKLGFFEALATNDMIAAKLEEVGFKDVRVTGQGSIRTAEGVWKGADATAPVDSHFIAIEEVSSTE